MIERKPHISELSEVAHVWYGSFSRNESNLPAFEQVLSEDEIEKASNFKFKKDRDSFIISRGILRELLGGYLAMSPIELKFEYTSYGKPYLPNQLLYFNVSHSGDMAAFAFTLNCEIGVDIERIKKDFDVLELARNFFSNNEIVSLERQPKEKLSRAFFRCWTRKESFIKAKGSGLSFPLNQFTVSFDKDHHATLLETNWDSSEKLNWSLFSFVPNEEYILAVALNKKIKTVEYFLWDM